MERMSNFDFQHKRLNFGGSSQFKLGTSSINFDVTGAGDEEDF